MLKDVTAGERKAIGGVMGAVISNILPQSMREDFIANYTCCPPPIFMIIISIIEVQNKTMLI